MKYFCMELVQYNEHLISAVDTDGLVLLRQGISSHNFDHASMNF